jgi:hypothetical protein
MGTPKDDDELPDAGPITDVAVGHIRKGVYLGRFSDWHVAPDIVETIERSRP